MIGEARDAAAAGGAGHASNNECGKGGTTEPYRQGLWRVSDVRRCERRVRYRARRRRCLAPHQSRCVVDCEWALGSGQPVDRRGLVVVVVDVV